MKDGQQKDIIYKSIETVKMFNVGDAICEYHNIEKHERFSDYVQTPKITIKNHLCKVVGNKLVKRTQISLPHKQMLIEDCFDFEEKNFYMNERNAVNSTNGSSCDRNQQNQKNESNANKEQDIKKKKLIFKKKKNIEEGKNTFDKRNTKNIAKNFAKAFQVHVGQNRKKQVIQKLKKLIDQTNYNNKLIHKISQEPELNWEFEKFLRNSAYNWIQTSKISDKQIHIEAIKLYLNLIQTREQRILLDSSDGSSSFSSVDEQRDQTSKKDSILNKHD